MAQEVYEDAIIDIVGPETMIGEAVAIKVRTYHVTTLFPKS